MTRFDPFWLIPIGIALSCATYWGSTINETLAPTPTAPTPGASIAYAPYVFVDATTGCQYLSTHTATGLVPRVAADGKTHMGCKGDVK